MVIKKWYSNVYNLIEYIDAYSKTSGSLWQNYRDEPALNNCGFFYFSSNYNNSVLFKFKQQIMGQTGNGGAKDVEIIVRLKYSSNFWRTLGKPFINCEISLQLK